MLTSFHDEAYRQKTLARHRRLKVIEEEKQELLREEQQDLHHRLRHDSFSQVPAFPEPTPGRETNLEKSSYSSTSACVTPLVATNDNQKRSRDEMKDGRSEPGEPTAKIARRQSLERFQIEPLKHTPPCGPVKANKKHTPQQDSTDISLRFTRPDLFEAYNASRRAKPVPDTRYFHMRSWNHENVRAAQRDCTWVTQRTNERTFIEAFERFRHVILFFSVNNSKAFQGIAEMGLIRRISQVLQGFPIRQGDRSFAGPQQTHSHSSGYSNKTCHTTPSVIWPTRSIKVFRHM